MYSGKSKANYVTLFFLAYLVLGLSIFDDYGIHYDEMNNQRFGQFMVRYTDYIFKHGSVPEGSGYRIANHFYIHGPIVELGYKLLVGQIGITSKRGEVLARHLMTFLIFYISSIYLFKLFITLSKNTALSLTATGFYILHPRIFSHSFFNSVDIPLLAFFTISLYTLYNFLKDPTTKTTIIHAIVTALAMNVRLVALNIIGITLIGILLKTLSAPATRHLMKRYAKQIAAYVILAMIFTYLMWPLLWQDPQIFLKSFEGSVESGRGVGSWTYIPFWVLTTTPEPILLFFLIGSIALITNIRHIMRYEPDQHIFIIGLLMVILSIAGVVYYRIGLYDGWRHLYFIYSSIVLVAFYGLQCTHKTLIKRFKMTDLMVITIVLVLFVPTVVFIIRYHPNQQIYGNIFAGENKSNIKFKNSLDYWGLSYRQAYEYLLSEYDGDLYISYDMYFEPENIRIFPYEQQERINFVSFDESDFYITNFKHNPRPTENLTEIMSLRYGREKYIAVYDLRTNR